MQAPHTITPLDPVWSVGYLIDPNIVDPTTNANWPTANLAIYIPFTLHSAATVKRLGWFNGGVVSGNVDCGIYDSALARVISAGSTAQSGTSTWQMVDIADTALAAGGYWIAIVLDNTTGRIGTYPSAVSELRGSGFAEQGTSFALPATATLAAMAQTIIPLVVMEYGTFT